jgi:hypothetical protein
MRFVMIFLQASMQLLAGIIGRAPHTVNFAAWRS